MGSSKHLRKGLLRSLVGPNKNTLASFISDIQLEASDWFEGLLHNPPTV